MSSNQGKKNYSGRKTRETLPLTLNSLFKLLGDFEIKPLSEQIAGGYSSYVW